MKKVLIIGSGGAGKSTFAKRLGEILAVEVFHLDSLYLRPGWVETPKPEWSTTVRGLLQHDPWIIDGNYGGTRDMRLKACDTVILLDLPPIVCLYRILKRTALLHGRTRPDMAEGCNERFVLEFAAWVWNYRKRNLPEVLSDLDAAVGKNIIILRSAREVDAFLSELKKKYEIEPQ